MDETVIDYERARALATVHCPKCGYSDPLGGFKPRYAKFEDLDPAERLYWSCRTCEYVFISTIASGE